jgi:hypothetical protein
MTSNVIVQQINGGPTGAKNAIINGNFGINQRGVSGTVTLAAGAYGHDRWKAGASGCTYTFATSENVTTLTISAGSLIQVVEGLNLLTDTYILSWQGTAQGKIGAGSYGNSGVTGSVTGGSNLNIEFGTGTVSKVQLERGTVATPFEFRSIGQELALCQRYYQTFGGNSNNYGIQGYALASTNVAIPHVFAVQMRAAPTVTLPTMSNTNTTGAIANNPGSSGFILYATAIANGAVISQNTSGGRGSAAIEL